MKSTQLYSRAFIATLFLATLGGCYTTAPQTKDAQGRALDVISCESPRTRPGYGPPPYRYWRIVGGTVPTAGFALESTLDAPGPMAWTFVGPRPVVGWNASVQENLGGRVASVACHPTNAAIAYIGTASGGVWKTIDTGANWTPLTDAMPNLNSGAVCIDQNFPAAIYAGTGEYVSGSRGDGIYRSLDEGASWSQIASAATLGYECSGLEVISGKSATAPAVIHWTGSSGYRRSTDGGSTWTNSGLASDCSSLAVDRTNPQLVYVAQEGFGIFKSINGGTSFAPLQSGLPPLATGAIRRIVIAIAPNAPGTLYAAFVNSSGGGLEGLYRTTNSGSAWTKLTQTPDFPTPQGWWSLSIGVDPTNANHVYCGGVTPLYSIAGVIETTDGGTSWTEICQDGGRIHPDQQCIAFGADNIPWFGCDGGIYRRSSAQWINCNATLAAIQNYSIAQHPSDPNRMMAGAQDNFTNGTASGSLAWEEISGGDGGNCAFGPSSYTTLYTSFPNLVIYRTVGKKQTSINGPWSQDLRAWLAPLVADPDAPDTLLAGSNRAWRTTNASTDADWTAISDTTVANGGTLSVITTVKSLPDVVWVGNSKGGVWRTTNGGQGWTQIRAADGVAITAICTRTSNSDTAFISRDASTGTRVLRTNDGATWTDMTGSLPASIQAKTLAVDWDRSVPTMYLGSGAGIYASFTLGASWVKNGTDLPNVNIGQLEIDPIRRTIIVGTYGRGAWRSPMPQPFDIDANGQIAGADLSDLLSSWGLCPVGGLCPADIDLNGTVDGTDLTMVLSGWNVPTGPP